MKRTILTALAAAALLFAAGPASAITVGDYVPGQPANGIAGSRHNMGAFGRVITSPNTTEICIFCHTPHHTNTSYGVAPLWNRSVQNPSSYSAYGDTMAGSSITTVSSTTLACLSCHDGLTTFDSIVNAPGKGGIVVGGQDRNWSFRMPTPGFTPDKKYDHFSGYGAPYGSDACYGCHTGISEAQLTNYINNVGRFNIGNLGDGGLNGPSVGLRDDHPVGVIYQEKIASLRPVTTNISQIPVNAGLDGVNTSPYAANVNQNLWAVKGYFNTTATIKDLLRGPNHDKVECSSCHDPHFSNKSWDEVESTWVDPTISQLWCGGTIGTVFPFTYTPPTNAESCSDGNFLRRVGGNTASGVCRTCHDK